MDWLEEKLEYFKNRFFKGSLLRGLIFYILAASLITIMAAAVTMYSCERWKQLVSSRYQSQFVYPDGVQEESYYLYYMEYPNRDNMKNTDKNIYSVMNTVQILAPIVYAIGAVILTSYLFYKNRLREPLSILRKQAMHIGRKELSFECRYDIDDEMGEVCHSFEQMRKTLISNEMKMWGRMEEQRRLNAAFAHDVRTPLTVVSGYTELLLKYFPEGKLSEGQMIENLELMKSQISRLINFTGTMKKINSLEEWKLSPKPISTEVLIKKANDFAQIMTEIKEIPVTVTNLLLEDKEWIVDEFAFLEVMENLTSNALRYAVHKVELILDEEGGKFLLLGVHDDGAGFSREALKSGIQPFYSERKNESESTHYGIGLFISNALCVKHGGYLELANSIRGGAMIYAAFQAENCSEIESF